VISPPVITLLTDYGLQDAFVGVCHGVIAGICPQARVIDVSHGVARHDIRAGALTLARALPYLPVGVHVVVVDPDVGSGRRAVALGTGDGRIFVGPDNGVLWPGMQSCGGVVEAADIGHSPLRLEPVSATFHGRDIFAPIAAHLAAGVAVADAGRPFDVAGLVRFEPGRARILEGELLVSVAYIDHFGNVQLTATHDDLDEFGLRLGRRVTLHLDSDRSFAARYVRTFADARDGELIVYEDSSRMLAIALRHGSAADRLGLRAGDALHVSALEE
jgi:hypothetical protein